MKIILQKKKKKTMKNWKCGLKIFSLSPFPFANMIRKESRESKAKQLKMKRNVHFFGAMGNKRVK